jgi:hypothetical protein
VKHPLWHLILYIAKGCSFQFPSSFSVRTFMLAYSYASETPDRCLDA